VTLVLATHNRGKLREYRSLLAELDLELRSLADVPGAPVVEEDGDTYLANARAKARAVAAYCRAPALADDSGLEVEALGGAPGVRSARFAADAGAGPGPSDDRANLALLLERMRDVPEARRVAHFRCVIVVARPDGRELVAEGSCAGTILNAPRGAGGFGYDPVFFYAPLQRSFAELSAAEKDRVSHRAQALQRLRSTLREFLS
jgi:XTP/dITP diphosphohydrolase